MNTSWGSKTIHRRKRTVLRAKIRWEMLGLQDPAQSSSMPSIEDIRRQITAAASQGLSPDTVSRSQQKEKNGHAKSASKLSLTARKRGTARQET